MITIRTINIASATLERAQRVVSDWIDQNPADVYVLSETSAGRGTSFIIDQFSAAGWKTIAPISPTKNERGVMIASRIDGTVIKTTHDGPEMAHRTVVFELDTSPKIVVVGVYIPNRGNDPEKLDRKTSYLDRWLPWLSKASGNRVLLGDFNIVPPSETPKFLPQMKFEYDWYNELTRERFVDLALAINGRHEPTWVYNHTGEGYTFDHILIEREISALATAFRYDHTARPSITDHSALEIQVDAKVNSFIADWPPQRPSQQQLF